MGAMCRGCQWPGFHQIFQLSDVLILSLRWGRGMLIRDLTCGRLNVEYYSRTSYCAAVGWDGVGQYWYTANVTAQEES